MGMVSRHNIKRAGDFLLGVLRDSTGVRYSRFYDGTRETQEWVLQGMGFSDPDGYTPDSPELLLDLAAASMAKQGFVKLTDLPEKLADEEPDYFIELTERGVERLKAGEQPGFRDVDL